MTLRTEVQADNYAGADMSTQQSQGPVRINVNLSRETYESLKRLAQDSDLDMSQFVRNALQVYTYLLNEQKANKRVYIGSDRVVETELLVPGGKLR